MDVRHKKTEWKAEIMKWTKSDLAERLMLAYVTIQNLEEKQDKKTDEIETAFRAGWNACEGDGQRKTTVNGAWYAYRRTL